MPLGGLLAYLNEISPVSLGPGDENLLAYQDADADITGDPSQPPAAGPEPEGAAEPGPYDDTIAGEGDEGFPTGPDVGGEGDPRKMKAIMALLAGAGVGGGNGLVG